MRTVKDRQTPYLIDPWQYLGEKRLRMLKTSWAGFFKEHCLPELPVGQIAAKFHEKMGRPSKELYTAVGAVILQQILDLSDEEVMRQLAFDIQWHYAFDLPHASENATYFCPRTLQTFQGMALEEDVDQEAFDKITDRIIRVLGVDTSKQRLDSTHVFSNMKKLGRVGIFVRTIRGFLTELRREFPGLFEELIPQEMRERYLGEKEQGCFAKAKPSQVDHTLKTLAEDTLRLVELFLAREDVGRLESFELLRRVLLEQCDVKGEDGEKTVEVKPSKEVSSDSLQNPADPDATYDAHKGQGYQLQMMETYTEVPKGEEKDETKPAIITYVELQQAHVHDSHALIPAIESTRERGCAPQAVTADGHYGSDENVEAARDLGVEVVAPTMGCPEKEEKLHLQDFKLDEENGVILECPAGQGPTKTEDLPNGMRMASFDVAVCQACPHRDRCPTRVGRRTARLSYAPKHFRLAVRRQREETDTWRDRYRWRAGIEGTNSRYKSQMGAGHLRVRGFEKVRFATVLKALGLNIFRAAKAMAARLRQVEARQEAVGASQPEILSPFTPLSRLLGALFASIGGQRRIASRLAA